MDKVLSQKELLKYIMQEALCYNQWFDNNYQFTEKQILSIIRQRESDIEDNYEALLLDDIKTENFDKQEIIKYLES